MSRQRNLAAIYEEFLTAVVRFAAQPVAVDDLGRFRRRMTGMLDQAQTAAQKEYAEPDAKMAELVAAALLDETVHKSAKKGMQPWTPVHPERFPKLGTLAGEKVFEDIDQLLNRPDTTDVADVLEVHLLCILLAFEGIFGIHGSGIPHKLRFSSLEKYREAVYTRVRRIRDRPRNDTPPGGGGPAPDPPDKWTQPLVIATAALFLMLLLLFFWFRISLGAALAQVTKT